MSKLESLQAAWRDAEYPPEGEAAAVRLIPALEARVRELEAALTDNAAHLAAAISLLERGDKAAKKAAASDKMFDIMLNDYRKSLERARAALAAVSAEKEGDSE